MESLKGSGGRIHVRTGTEEHAADVAIRALGEDFGPGCFTQFAFPLNRGHDHVSLANDFGIVDRSMLALERGENDGRLLNTIVLHEPTRRLGQERQSDQDDDQEEALEGDGPAPREGRWIGLLASQTHEGAERMTEGDQGALDDQHSLIQISLCWSRTDRASLTPRF